jgi:hypothetical protein
MLSIELKGNVFEGDDDTIREAGAKYFGKTQINRNALRNRK